MERQWTPEDEALARRIAQRACGRFLKRKSRSYRALIDEDAYLMAAHQGVVQAFRSYDPKRGVRLSTWMYSNAWHELQHEDRDMFPGGGRYRYGPEREAIWAVSLDAIVTDEGDLLESSALATDGGIPDPLGTWGEQARDWLLLLDKKRRKVLEMRFFQDMSQQEVAGVMGYSQMHVSRMERQGLAKIRAALGVTL